MSNLTEKVVNEIHGTYRENGVYILNSWDVKSEIETMERFENKGDIEMAEYCYKGVLERAERFNNERLSPVTVNVGDGVTIHLFSDAHAGTVIKKTKCSITVQQDKATIDPNFKPEFVVGGFAGHCTNQNEQTYTYERDPNGTVQTFRWSNKYNRYQGGGDGSVTVTKGRREFYDYNF